MTRCIFVVLLILCGACGFARPYAALDQQRSLELIDRGVLALEDGYVDSAHASFEMAYEVFPNATALDGLGCVALYQGELALARQYFELALEQDENYHRARGHLAMLAELEGRSEEAEKLYREYLFYEPENIRIRNNFAVFLSDKNKRHYKDEAQQELLRASSVRVHPILKRNFMILEQQYE